jgi:hypothetical protein
MAMFRSSCLDALPNRTLTIGGDQRSRSNIAILAVASFAKSPNGYIAELGTSLGTLLFAGLNFVQMRNCKGGISPPTRARYTETQCRASSNFITIAELQQLANTRSVAVLSESLRFRKR